MGWSTNGLGRETADVDWASIREAGEGALRRASACVASFTWVTAPTIPTVRSVAGSPVTGVASASGKGGNARQPEIITDVVVG